MIELRQYIDRNGRNAFERWFTKLSDQTQARITVALDRVEHGNFAAIKSVGAGVLELRLDFGPGYRLYCGRDGEELVILLGGGSKQRQQIDIEAAKALWQEYKARKRGGMMALTKSFNETVKVRLAKSSGFRRALLREAVGLMIAGDVETGKSILRKYINGTIGFVPLGEALGHSSKTLMRMLSPSGNPHLRNFFEIIAYLQKIEGTVLEVVDKSAA